MRGGRQQRRKVAKIAKDQAEGLSMRIGTVTDAGPPLEITVGGSSSDTPYRPHALASASFSNGDQVAVLVQGNDMLVLGVIA